MNKKDCINIGLHVLAVAGLGALYYCIMQDNKKTKLKIDSLDSFC